MSPELSIILALLGGFGTIAAVTFGIINAVNNRSKNEREGATTIAVISTKLDLMLSGIEDVKKGLARQDSELQTHKTEVGKEITEIKIEMQKLKHQFEQIQRVYTSGREDNQ